MSRQKVFPGRVHSRHGYPFQKLDRQSKAGSGRDDGGSSGEGDGSCQRFRGHYHAANEKANQRGASMEATMSEYDRGSIDASSSHKSTLVMKYSLVYQISF